MVLSKEKMEQSRINTFCPDIYKELKKPLELVDFLKIVKSNKIKINVNELRHFSYFFTLNDEEDKLICEILKIKNSNWVIESTDVEDSELVNDSIHVYSSKYVRESHDVKFSENVGGSFTIVSSTDVTDSKFIFNSKNVKSSVDVRDSKNIETSYHITNSNMIFDGDSIDDSFCIEFSNDLKNCFFCKTSCFLNNGILCYSFNSDYKDKYYFCNKEITKERFESYVNTIKVLMDKTYNGSADKETTKRELESFYEWAIGLPEADEEYINVILKKGRYNL